MHDFLRFAHQRKCIDTDHPDIDPPREEHAIDPPTSKNQMRFEFLGRNPPFENAASHTMDAHKLQT